MWPNEEVCKVVGWVYSESAESDGACVPDTHVADAFDALDKFCAMHNLRSCVVECDDKSYRCVIRDPDGDDESVSGTAETRCRAICQAIVAAAETIAQREPDSA